MLNVVFRHVIVTVNPVVQNELNGLKGIDSDLIL